MEAFLFGTQGYKVEESKENYTLEEIFKTDASLISFDSSNKKRDSYKNSLTTLKRYVGLLEHSQQQFNEFLVKTRSILETVNAPLADVFPDSEYKANVNKNDDSSLEKDVEKMDVSKDVELNSSKSPDNKENSQNIEISIAKENQQLENECSADSSDNQNLNENVSENMVTDSLASSDDKESLQTGNWKLISKEYEGSDAAESYYSGISDETSSEEEEEEDDDIEELQVNLSQIDERLSSFVDRIISQANSSSENSNQHNQENTTKDTISQGHQSKPENSKSSTKSEAQKPIHNKGKQFLKAAISEYKDSSMVTSMPNNINMEQLYNKANNLKNETYEIICKIHKLFIKLDKIAGNETGKYDFIQNYLSNDCKDIMPTPKLLKYLKHHMAKYLNVMSFIERQNRIFPLSGDLNGGPVIIRYG